MRVLVLGTGGVGGYFGAVLAAAGRDVVFVARGANLDALRERGLHVRGARSLTIPDVRATDRPEDAGTRDLVLHCVKAYDLDETTEAVRPCGGLVLTLQNGVDAADRVRARLGDVVLAGSTNIVADLTAPGEVHLLSSYARIRFGEPGGGKSARVDSVAGILDVPGIEVDPLDDVRPALWEKMALICAMAGLTTLCRSPVGPILADPNGHATFRRLVDECASVARASGVALPPDFAALRERYAQRIDPAATSSMLRDFMRGKPLEVDHLHGTIVELGARLGVEVPVTEAVYAGIALAAASRGAAGAGRA